MGVTAVVFQDKAAARTPTSISSPQGGGECYTHQRWPRLRQEDGAMPNPTPGEILLEEGFFLGLQADYDLMQRRREIAADLKAIAPR